MKNKILSVILILFIFVLSVSAEEKALSGIWQEYLFGHEKLVIPEDGTLIVDQINDIYSSVSDCNTFLYLEREPKLIYIDIWGIDEALGKHKRTEKNIIKLKRANTRGLAQSYIVDEKITLDVKKGDVAILVPEAFVSANGEITEPVINISLNGKAIKENYILKVTPFTALPKRMQNIKTQYWNASDKTAFLSSLKEKEDKKIQSKPLKYQPIYESEFFTVNIDDNYYLRGIDFGWKGKDVLPASLPPAGMTLYILFNDASGHNYDKLAEYMKIYKFARVVIGAGYDNFSNKNIDLIAKNIILQLKAIQDARLPIYIPVWVQQDGSDIVLLKKLQEAGIKGTGLWIGALHLKTANFSLPFERYKNFGYKNYVVGQYLDELDAETINNLKIMGYIGVCRTEKP